MFENWQGCTAEEERKKRREENEEKEGERVRAKGDRGERQKKESCSLSFADKGERE